MKKKISVYQVDFSPFFRTLYFVFGCFFTLTLPVAVLVFWYFEKPFGLFVYFSVYTFMMCYFLDMFIPDGSVA